MAEISVLNAKSGDELSTVGPGDFVAYFEVLAWEQQRDEVARFDHWQIQPLPSAETMAGYRRMKAYLKGQQGDG